MIRTVGALLYFTSELVFTTLVRWVRDQARSQVFHRLTFPVRFLPPKHWLRMTTACNQLDCFLWAGSFYGFQQQYYLVRRYFPKWLAVFDGCDELHLHGLWMTGFFVGQQLSNASRLGNNSFHTNDIHFSALFMEHFVNVFYYFKFIMTCKYLLIYSRVGEEGGSFPALWLTRIFRSLPPKWAIH